MPVTTKLLHGSWQLVDWSVGLGEDLYFYIDFDTATMRFASVDNIGSMYASHKSGTFTLTQERERYLLSGTYDNGVGDWQHSYEVVAHDNDHILWRVAKSGEVMSFERVESIPEL